MKVPLAEIVVRMDLDDQVAELPEECQWLDSLPGEAPVRVPGIDARLLVQLVAFVQQLRGLDLKKLPSVSETIDWARVMVLMHTSVLAEDVVRDTLNVLLKFESDIEAAAKRIADFTRKAQQAVAINR